MLYIGKYHTSEKHCFRHVFPRSTVVVAAFTTTTTTDERRVVPCWPSRCTLLYGVGYVQCMRELNFILYYIYILSLEKTTADSAVTVDMPSDGFEEKLNFSLYILLFFYNYQTCTPQWIGFSRVRKWKRQIKRKR